MEQNAEPRPSSKAQASPVEEVNTSPEGVQQLADRLFAAKQSTETEIKMSLWEALKLYPMASLWSILISFAVVMEGRLPCYSGRESILTCPLGYDIILLGSFCKYFRLEAYPNSRACRWRAVR